MMTDMEWRLSRVNGAALDPERDPSLWLPRTLISLPYGKIYRAANEWTVSRDPGYSGGAWLWIAERTTRGKVELRGFDQLTHARAWCRMEGK